MKRFSLLVMTLSLSFLCFAQDSPSLSPGMNGGAGIFLPADYTDKFTEEVQQNVQFLSYPYSSGKIDLRDFRKNYPDANLPEYLDVVPPGFADVSAVTILLGMPQQKIQTVDDVIIWLVKDYGTNEVTFHIDQDLDRNFNNDAAPIVLYGGKAPTKITMTPPDSKPVYSLNIAVPKVPKARNNQINPTKVATLQNRILNQFSIGIFGSFGYGQLKYNYDNLALGFPTWYEVNVTEKGLGATVSYSLRRVRIGVTASIQNLDFYTSYLNVRTNDPEITVDPRTGLDRVIDNVEINRSIDNHANNKVFWSLDLLLRSYLSPTTELQPYASLGYTTYLPGEYVADRRFDGRVYELPAMQTAEFGVRTEFAGSNDKAFYASFGVQNIWWEPTDFVGDIPHENLETSYLNYRMSVGYIFGL